MSAQALNPAIASAIAAVAPQLGVSRNRLQFLLSQHLDKFCLLLIPNDKLCVIANQHNLAPGRKFIRRVALALQQDLDLMVGLSENTVLALVRQGGPNDRRRMKKAERERFQATGKAIYWDEMKGNPAGTLELLTGELGSLEDERDGLTDPSGE
jgi:hypothetical protein